MNPRPSKHAFARLFRRAVERAEPFQTVLDFACSRGKSRPLFEGREYHGADVSEPALAKARETYGDVPDTHFHQADLLNPGDVFAGKVFDLVVCTHTIMWLPPDRRAEALDTLAGFVRPGGAFILQGTQEVRDAAEDSARHFQKAEFTGYRGGLSRAYEDALMGLMGTGNLGTLGRETRFPGDSFLLPLLGWTGRILAPLDGLFGAHHFVALYLGRKENGRADRSETEQ